jgi:DnaJ-class molecular chaperone
MGYAGTEAVMDNLPQFSVLDDDNKREIYDRYGEQGLREGGSGADGFSPEDFLSQMFPGFGGFGGFGGGRCVMVTALLGT